MYTESEESVIKFVFFDLGLTLVENGMPERYREAMEKCGIFVSGERAADIYHLTNKYFMRERQGEMGKGNPKVFEDYVSFACALAGNPAKVDAVRKELLKQAESVWSAFPYTVSVLQGLRQRGLGIGLISNWDSSCRKVLAENDLMELLDVVVISSEEKVEKPDARIFEEALSRAGVSGEDCLYVGDNYYDDGVGAAKVRMKSLIINPPDYLGIEELKEKGITVISDIREILQTEVL